MAKCMNLVALRDDDAGARVLVQAMTGYFIACTPGQTIERQFCGMPMHAALASGHDTFCGRTNHQHHLGGVSS